jgi:hypothetical protein
MPQRSRSDSGWPTTIMPGLSPATGAWMSEPHAEQDGGVLAFPPRRARRLVFAVTGLAPAVALAAAGVIIATRQPPPRPVATLPGPAGQAPCSAAFSPGGTTLAVAGCGDSVALWDIATRRQVATLTSPRCPLAGQVTFSPDGRALALFGGRAVSPNGRRYHPAACLWNMATRRETTLTDPPLLADTSTQGAFSPGGTTLACSAPEAARWHATFACPEAVLVPAGSGAPATTRLAGRRSGRRRLHRGDPHLAAGGRSAPRLTPVYVWDRRAPGRRYETLVSAASRASVASPYGRARNRSGQAARIGLRARRWQPRRPLPWHDSLYGGGPGHSCLRCPVRSWPGWRTSRPRPCCGRAVAGDAVGGVTTSGVV